MLKDPAVERESNGYEALRRFHLDIEPRSGAAALGLLETILTVPAPPKGTNLRDSLIAVERLFADYEATSSETLSEHVKIAALRRLLPEEMKVHLNMMVKDATKYAEVKAVITEYEVAERRYLPLSNTAVFDHSSGVAPMDVDQVQAGKGGKGQQKGKGKAGQKGDKPTCKVCGKAHKGECWHKGAPAKGKGAQKGKGQGQGSSDGKAKCQICGKNNHTADKCYQRYKENKDGKDGKGKVRQVTAPETGATVTVVRQQEVETSPETELRTTSTGVRSCTEDGRALVLVDSGSDEHLCPEDFAPWCKAAGKRGGPILRDAQGSIISHGSRYRIVTLRLYSDGGGQADIEIPFLIAPVKQPILSLGKLVEHLDARLAIGTGGVGQLHVESMAFALRKQMHSYYVACYPLAPKDDFWVQRVSETKMMAISEDVVKYKRRMGVEPAALELPGPGAAVSREKPQGVKVEPEKEQPSGTRKLIPVKQEGQTLGKASSETKESVEAEEAPEPAQASQPTERTSASARKVPPAEEEADGQREDARPPEDSAEKRLASLKVRPQDKSPLVSSPSDDEPDYRRTSEEEEPSSSYEEVTVEPLRLRSRSRKRDAGKGRPPEPAYPPYSRPGSRKRTDWTDEERRADNWNARQRKKARKKELGHGQEKGKSKGKRRNKTKDSKGKAHYQAYAVTCDQWVHVAGEGDGDDHWTVSPDGQVVTYHHQSSRRGLYVPSDQDLESLGITQQKLTNRRVTTVFGKDDQTLEFIDDWRSPGDVPEAVNLDWVGTTEFQLTPEEAVAQGPRAHDPVDVPRPQPLNANSRVADLKTRLKQLGAPVWGDKARLWARLQEYEARGKASRDLEAQLQLREEELNRDPALGRQPVELPVPSPPSEVERLLHELTHLPYAPWCEACVRGRGRDLPHFGLQVGDSGALDHARLRPRGR